LSKAADVGIRFPRILIPGKSANNKKWPVLSCNEFSGDGYYWDRTTKAAGPLSTLHITVPQIYQQDFDTKSLVGSACETMVEYIENGVLGRLPAGMIVVDRKTAYSRRIGVVLAIDLEQFDTNPEKQPLIRCSVKSKPTALGTALRSRAILECPNIILAIDDPENKVIGEAFRARANHTKIYDIPLMQDGGRVKGWFIDDEDAMDDLVSSLAALKRKSPGNMLFAAMDGGAELAAAKHVWESAKKTMSAEELNNNPLRYALVEVTNISDKYAELKPVHLLLENVDADMVLRELTGGLNAEGLMARRIKSHGVKVLKDADVQTIYFKSMSSKGRIEIKEPGPFALPTTVINVLSALTANSKKMNVSCVYDADELAYLCEEPSTLGLIMPSESKEHLFGAIHSQGILPECAFSLGRPEEKRYHLECRMLINPEDYR